MINYQNKIRLALSECLEHLYQLNLSSCFQNAFFIFFKKYNIFSWLSKRLFEAAMSMDHRNLTPLSPRIIICYLRFLF